MSSVTPKEDKLKRKLAKFFDKNASLKKRWTSLMSYVGMSMPRSYCLTGARAMVDVASESVQRDSRLVQSAECE
jgi:hypothetical protein